MRGIIALVVAAWACGPGTRPDPGGGDDSPGPDGGEQPGPGGGENVGQTYVYAHTSATLYRVDPDTLQIQRIGDFGWPSRVVTDEMTDLAIDKTGRMIGISFGRVYRVDPTNARATLLSESLSGMFNGLSFVPADMLGQTGDDILVGTRNVDGAVFRIDPMTGQATQVGDMGAAFQSSGDLVAVKSFGTAQTIVGGSSDVLAKLAPMTFQATTAPASTGFDDIYGVAFWKNTVFGFTRFGDFVTIDPITGVATRVQGNGPAWWGAAVTTTAPVIQ